MGILRDILVRAALVCVLAASAGAGSALAGEKIIFSGRDGRQSKYHRSLNARPLFMAPRIEQALGNGESPLDAFNVTPAMTLQKLPRNESGDKDWIFRSPEEMGEEGAEKDFSGEDEEFDKDGFKRTPAERYLERKREEGMKGDDAKDAAENLSKAVEELDRDPLLADFKANQLSRAKLSEPKSAVELAAESRAASRAVSGPGGSPGGPDFGGKAFVEYQRAHIDKLKQTLGVSAAIGNRSDAGSGISPGSVGGNAMAPMAGASPFGLSSPGSPGAYPGSQGLGLKSLTTPITSPGFTPMPGPARDPSQPARDRYKPSRLKQPKRNMF